MGVPLAEPHPDRLLLGARHGLAARDQALAVAGDKTKTCSASAAKAQNVACATEQGCPIERSAGLLLAAVEKMDACCGKETPGQADVVAAIQTLAKAYPQAVCEEKLASLTSGSAACSSTGAKTVTVAAKGDCASACSTTSRAKRTGPSAES